MTTINANHRLAKAFILAATGLAIAPAAQAITSTAQLKTACESAPNRVVQIEQSIKINTGAPPNRPERINGACTLVLGPNGNLETDSIGVQFTGAFTVQAPHKVKVRMVETVLRAASINLALSGRDIELAADDSQLAALNGNLSISFGEQGSFSFIEQHASAANGLQALRAFRLTAGQKFNGVLAKAIVSAPSGVSFDLDGAESNLKLEASTLIATAGSVAVLGGGAKTVVEAFDNQWFYGANALLRLDGAQSSARLEKTSLRGGASGGAAGSVVIEAGVGSAASQSSVEVNELVVPEASAITIAASRSAIQGQLSLQKSQLTSLGTLRVATGRSGSTSVQDNSLSARGALSIATGTGGSCVATPNSLRGAPVTAC